LNDLYVRFFRMAERRIAERTGQGIVSFISNYSWLDGLSFTGMRERYVEAFDAIRIDCLNGDKYKTGKIAPDGSPDPSIFSTESNRVGIHVGTAVATLVRKADHEPASEVHFRHLWGRRKREELLELETADSEPEVLYEGIEPSLPLGMPFLRTTVDERWFDWPALPELFPVRFHGVLTNRDAFLVDVDLNRLRDRVGDYFDPSVTHEEIERRYPSAMKSTARFDAQAGREALLARGGPVEDGFCRITYRPFDNRWLYWEKDTKLLDEKRAEYRQHVDDEYLWFTASQHVRQDASEPQAVLTTHLGSHHLIERGSNLFPAQLRQEAALGADAGLHGNLSVAAQRYLKHIGADVEDLFHFVLATLHDARYRAANADGLRLGWPRIPLPGWSESAGEARAEQFHATLAQGRELARLLDPDRPVPGVTAGQLRPEIAPIAVPTTIDGQQMTSACAVSSVSAEAVFQK
jgi:predicted helicase